MAKVEIGLKNSEVLDFTIVGKVNVDIVEAFSTCGKSVILFNTIDPIGGSKENFRRLGVRADSIDWISYNNDDQS